MTTFWQDLPRPFTALAPLDGVTDIVFRQIIAEIGKPDVMFTEFMMTDGFVSSGKKRVMERLQFGPLQKPMVAQIWGTIPEHFYQTAKEIGAMGFAGIDINMGCPIRDVIKYGACSALIKNPSLAGEIIQAVREGGGLPVSVKTRIGFETEQIEEWIGFLLKQDIDALTVHLRTARELSTPPAHWEYMPQIKKLRDTLAPRTILIGNGDITSLGEIRDKFLMYGCEGYMVGRGIFANPWLFNTKKSVETISIQERIALFAHHIDLFEKQWGGKTHFASLKKFAKTYMSNFSDASAFREELMKAKTLAELKSILHAFPVQ